MGVSKNNGTSKSSILIGVSIIFTIHFGVPLFLETPTSEGMQRSKVVPNDGSREVVELRVMLASLEVREQICESGLENN